MTQQIVHLHIYTLFANMELVLSSSVMMSYVVRRITISCLLLFIVCYAKLLIGSSLISLQLISPSTSASTEVANHDDTAIQLLP